MIETFKKDVEKGLERTPKMLSSKYFYDKKGDALFVEIMNLPEYYLTKCELDIFQTKTEELIDCLGLKSDVYFELIELGAGDGTKTKELLRKLIHQNFNFEYTPIDISLNALNLLEKDLMKELPQIAVKLKQGDYFTVLSSLNVTESPKVLLFLGSNIGNLTDDLAAKFMDDLAVNLHKGDKVLLGVDLIKAKEIVLPAYNDSAGITARFNLNLLQRINTELGGNFKLNQFVHQPEYDENEGIAKSFIVSKINQSVTIEAIGRTFDFSEGEKIHTEISRKYNDALIQKIISNTGFRIEHKLLDGKAYFADYILGRD